MISSWQRVGRDSFTSAFSVSLDTVNLTNFALYTLENKALTKLLIMEGFIHYPLFINSYEVSKAMPCLVPLMLTITWGIDILFEKLTP